MMKTMRKDMRQVRKDLQLPRLSPAKLVAEPHLPAEAVLWQCEHE